MKDRQKASPEDNYVLISFQEYQKENSGKINERKNRLLYNIGTALAQAHHNIIIEALEDDAFLQWANNELSYLRNNAKSPQEKDTIRRLEKFLYVDDIQRAFKNYNDAKEGRNNLKTEDADAYEKILLQILHNYGQAKLMNLVEKALRENEEFNQWMQEKKDHSIIKKLIGLSTSIEQMPSPTFSQEFKEASTSSSTTSHHTIQSAFDRQESKREITSNASLQSTSSTQDSKTPNTVYRINHTQLLETLATDNKTNQMVELNLKNNLFSEGLPTPQRQMKAFRDDYIHRPNLLGGVYLGEMLRNKHKEEIKDVLAQKFGEAEAKEILLAQDQVQEVVTELRTKHENKDITEKMIRDELNLKHPGQADKIIQAKEKIKAIVAELSADDTIKSILAREVLESKPDHFLKTNQVEFMAAELITDHEINEALVIQFDAEKASQILLAQSQGTNTAEEILQIRMSNTNLANCSIKKAFSKSNLHQKDGNLYLDYTSYIDISGNDPKITHGIVGPVTTRYVVTQQDGKWGLKFEYIDTPDTLLYRMLSKKEDYSAENMMALTTFNRTQLEIYRIACASYLTQAPTKQDDFKNINKYLSHDTPASDFEKVTQVKQALKDLEIDQSKDFKKLLRKATSDVEDLQRIRALCTVMRRNIGLVLDAQTLNEKPENWNKYNLSMKIPYFSSSSKSREISNALIQYEILIKLEAMLDENKPPREQINAFKQAFDENKARLQETRHSRAKRASITLSNLFSSKETAPKTSEIASDFLDKIKKIKTRN